MVPAEKLQDRIAYPPRGLRSERAAAYVGLSETTFLRMVDEGTMPQPIRHGGVTVWDRLDLDAAFDGLKDGAQNTMHRILRERRDAKRTETPLPKDGKG
jgi:predicted DNA-binding transcriptional regulator AlpA